MPLVVAWILLLAATAAASALAGLANIPGPTLFAALIVGVIWSLAVKQPRLRLAGPLFMAAQAVLGVQLGAYLTGDTVSEVAHEWLPVTIVSVLTLALTVVAGILLARFTSLDRPTASLGMIAGGASGIVAISDDLGADGRLVAVMQYLRVLVIVLLMPVLASVAFGVDAVASSGGDVPFLDVAGVALVLGAGVVGVFGGLRLKLPAPALMGPMLLTGALSLAGVTGSTEVPDAIRQVAYVGIGLQVGLRFTPDSLREARAVLVPVLATIAALLVGCAGLGWVLAELTGVSFFEGYLATTPGGLFAVLGVALASGVNTTFILAVQSLRLFVMVLAAPAIVRRLTAEKAT